ncbi:MAG TPA: ABC transporter substrate-binding protein [Thiobacillaceae bacterium]|nr:ABC transporter substrate-binding protein [Thiobacillaceae bacterium]
MLRSFLLALATALALTTGPAYAADTPPDELARATTHEVLEILKQDKDMKSGDIEKVYRLVEAKVLPNFDFNRMTQLALGKHWPRATAKQKQALVTEFRNLLVRTYSTSLTAYTNQTVEFKPLAMKPDATDVTVRSEIRQPGGLPIPIDYSMYKTAFGWKVYDVAIDGVSLVTNYRASFSNTIRQNGIDGLIKTMSAQSTRSEAKPAPRSGS